MKKHNRPSKLTPEQLAEETKQIDKIVNLLETYLRQFHPHIVPQVTRNEMYNFMKQHEGMNLKKIADLFADHCLSQDLAGEVQQ